MTISPPPRPPTPALTTRDPPTPSPDAEAAHGPRGVRLLVADPELGRGLSEEALAVARQQVVVPLIHLDRGPWDIQRLYHDPAVGGDVYGFLVLEGALTMDVWISGRTCTRLLSQRDLVLLDGDSSDSIPVTWGWTVVMPTALAILDLRLLVIGRRWPALLSEILKRAAHQTHAAFLQQAISQMPRVEERLLALMWAIADRQGVVRGDDVWLSLPVTHETLARMIGAQRPTVSLGLTRLAERGWLRGEDGGWLISRGSLEEFSPPHGGS